MGDHFTLLKKFDRCLHSLCVLNGRKANEVKSQKHYHLKVCPFGTRVRRAWQHGLDPSPPDGNIEAGDINVAPDDGEENWLELAKGVQSLNTTEVSTSNHIQETLPVEDIEESQVDLEGARLIEPSNDLPDGAPYYGQG